MGSRYRATRFGSFAARGAELHPPLFALEQSRADVARRWKAWQARLDPERLVFIDET